MVPIGMMPAPKQAFRKNSHNRHYSRLPIYVAGRGLTPLSVSMHVLVLLRCTLVRLLRCTLVRQRITLENCSVQEGASIPHLHCVSHHCGVVVHVAAQLNLDDIVGLQGLLRVPSQTAKQHNKYQVVSRHIKYQYFIPVMQHECEPD